MNQNPKEKSTRIELRVKAKEKSKIQSKARKCELSTTEYVKQRALGYEPKVVPPTALFFLEKIGNLDDKSTSPELNAVFGNLLKEIASSLLLPGGRRCTMAVTGFWPIYKNLKATLDYADNPDKTTAPEYLDNDLYTAVRYAENDRKTDRKMYVGGINCSGQNAYAEMIAVKRRFGLRGKVVGYHGIQSFKEGEVTSI